MKCRRCGGRRVARVCGKTSDLCGVTLGRRRASGYVPRDMGICAGGNSDYLDFSYCLDCGQIQGPFPLPKTALEARRAGA
jgi:hypothetical protein